MDTLDIQGHRGCRGLYPENSIPAFIHAVDIGVNTLEFDVVISQDNKVIISHDPFISSDFCLDTDGSIIENEQEPAFNIYRLDYEEIKSFDCGSKFFERFPKQKKIPVHKPSLEDMIMALRDAYDDAVLEELHYNIEIKRKPGWDTLYHPEFRTFADLVVADITQLGIMNRTTVQCFDVPTLQYLYAKYPEVKLVYLIYNEHTPDENIEKLGFFPTVYSPHYELVDPDLVAYCHERDIRLIPWTVNSKTNMRKLIDMGVDGIITDYPDRLLEVAGRS